MSSPSDTNTHATDTGATIKQAPDRVPNGTLMLVTVIAMLVGGACVLIAGCMQSCEMRRQRQGIASYPAPAPPGTIEQSLLRVTRRGLDQVAADKRTLEHYGWVDRPRDIARLPITTAMDLLEEESR